MKKFFIHFIVFLFLLTPSANIVSAQASTSLVPASPDTNKESLICPDNFTIQINNPVSTFYGIVDSTLKTPNLNSETLDYLFDAFRDANYELFDLKKELSNSATSNLDSCAKLIEKTQKELHNGFLNAYTILASRKRSFLLYEKYDAINTKFESMQTTLRSLSQNIRKFTDLLPCFAKSCLSR